MNPGFSAQAYSCGLGLRFSGPEFGEIGGRGLFEAMLAFQARTDFADRKNEPIFSGLIFQTIHFSDLKKLDSFLHFYFTLRFSGGLEGLQEGEVALHGFVEALFVQGEELELVRFPGKDAGGVEGGIDLLVIGVKLAGVALLAQGEEVVFDGAGPVESPTVGGDALGQLGCHSALGGEAADESLRKLFVSGALLIGHRRDLAGEAVTERVQAGALAALYRFGSRGQTGVVAIGGELFIGDHFVYLN